ncbi:MAG: DUF3098 domain-containing protein [Balneolaceae bacterium]
MPTKRRIQKTKKEPMLFSESNYKLLGIGILFVVSGFTAMYIENEFKGFISLYISPIVIMIGYITVIFAILKKDSSPQNKNANHAAS